jgi:polysaccharide biosynthesis protein PelC
MLDQRKIRGIKSLIAFLALMVICGCGGSSTFLDRSYNYSYLERVAVIPFDNLSQQSQTAGRQATLIFITELLSREVFTVVEPGETAKVLGEVNPGKGASLDIEQIKEVGKRLHVQGLFFGTISESASQRSGGGSGPVITLDVRLVETDSAATIWASTRTAGRPGTLAMLLGLNSKSNGEIMRDCSRKILGTLIK